MPGARKVGVGAYSVRESVELPVRFASTGWTGQCNFLPLWSCRLPLVLLQVVAACDATGGAGGGAGGRGSSSPWSVYFWDIKGGQVWPYYPPLPPRRPPTTPSVVHSTRHPPVLLQYPPTLQESLHPPTHPPNPMTFLSHNFNKNVPSLLVSEHSG